MCPAFASDVWGQLKSLTAGDLIAALERDGWTRDLRGGSQYIYRKQTPLGVLRVSVHFHPAKTYGPNMLRGLLADIGWAVEDMRRLKLIK